MPTSLGINGRHRVGTDCRHHRNSQSPVLPSTVDCFPPVRSPESNGVCEAFVKTSKRDYARVNLCPDAITVLQQLSTWFEDYNAAHPHSSLRMLSPREFIVSQLSTPATCPV